MSVRIYQRRGTSAEWSSANTLLGDGEIGYDTTAKQYKIGDGVTLWNSLPYQDTRTKTITSNYTLDQEDFGQTLLVNSNTPVKITVPKNTSEALPLGFNAKIMQIGNGTVTIESEKNPAGTEWETFTDHMNTFVAWEWAQDLKFGDGKFLIAGYYGNLFVSETGHDFENLVSPFSTYYGSGGFRIAYGNDKWVIGPYYGAEGFAYVSTDLYKWDVVRNTLPHNYNGTYATHFINNKFFMASIDGITYSTDGYAWTSAEMPQLGKEIRYMSYGPVDGNNAYVAITQGDSWSGTMPTLVTSTDGQIWTTTAWPASINETEEWGVLQNIQDPYVEYHNGKWVLGALSLYNSGGQPHYAQSTDFVNWTQITFPVVQWGDMTGNDQYNPHPDGGVSKMRYGNGTWMITGYGWNYQQNMTKPEWNSAGEYSWLPWNASLMSTDLITWTSLPSVQPVYVADWAGGMDYGNGRWVMGGYYNNVGTFIEPKETNAVDIKSDGNLSLSKNSYVNLEKLGTNLWTAESTSKLSNLKELPVSGEFNKIDVNEINSGDTYKVRGYQPVKHVMIPMEDTLPVGTEFEIVNTGGTLVRVVGEFDTDFILNDWTTVIVGSGRSRSIAHGNGTFLMSLVNNYSVMRSNNLTDWTTASTTDYFSSICYNDAYDIFVGLTPQSGLKYSKDQGDTWTTIITNQANQAIQGISSKWFGGFDRENSTDDGIDENIATTVYGSKIVTDGHNKYVIGNDSSGSQGSLFTVTYFPGAGPVQNTYGSRNLTGTWGFEYYNRVIKNAATGTYNPSYTNGIWTVGGYYGQVAVSLDGAKTWQYPLNSTGNYQGGIGGGYSYIYGSHSNKSYGQITRTGSYGENVTSTDGKTWYFGGGYPVYQFNEDKHYVNTWGSYSNDGIEGPQGFMLHIPDGDSSDIYYSYDGTKHMSGFAPQQNGDIFGNMSPQGGSYSGGAMTFGGNKFVVGISDWSNGGVAFTSAGDYVKIDTPAPQERRYADTLYGNDLNNGYLALEDSGASVIATRGTPQEEYSNRFANSQRSTIKPFGKAKLIKTDDMKWQILGDLQ